MAWFDVTCPNCGTVRKIAEGEIGLTALCSHCGRRLPDPQVPVTHTHAAAKQAVRPSGAVVLVVMGVIAVAIGAVLAVLHSPKAPRDSGMLLDLKHEAESLEAAGKHQEAFNKYRELESTWNDQPSDDPDIRRVVSEAREARSRILFEIVDEDMDKAAPTVEYAPSATGPAVRGSDGGTSVANGGRGGSGKRGGVGAEAGGDAGGGGAQNGGGVTNPLAPKDGGAGAVDDRHGGASGVVQAGSLGGAGGGDQVGTTAPAGTISTDTGPMDNGPVALGNSATISGAMPGGPKVNVAPPVVAAADGPLLGHLNTRPVLPNEDALDEQIGVAIQKGADFLSGEFELGQIRAAKDNQTTYYTGLDALCVYALLQAGDAVPDDHLDPHGDFVKTILNRLKDMPIENKEETYAHALRAVALAKLNRPEDKDTLKEDVDWLIAASMHGAYTYDDHIKALALAKNVTVWDNSNSQYGLLGVWAGAESGMEVPNQYWQDVEGHWSDSQTDDGQWAYGLGNSGEPTLSMTLAGAASLFVTHDYLDSTQVANKVGLPPFSPALQKALSWIEEGDHSVTINGGGWGAGYSLYALERVGLASGFKYFGAHDWYRELAAVVVGHEAESGGWSRETWADARMQTLETAGGHASDAEVLETAYCLLFLSRGRHPVMMNKMRFDGDWANRPRDVANLARFAGRELERPLNWQVISFDRDWRDWLDSPILYLASENAPNLKDADYENIKAFVEAGGLLYTQADDGSPAFNAFAEQLAKRLFPDYPMQFIPDESPLYSVSFHVTDHPPMKYVTNGSRILMIHSPTDLSMAWQQRAEITRKSSFELGTNIFLYATGKSDLRNRLSSLYIPAATDAATDHIKIASLRYGGNWNPEPYALWRFARYFQNETGVASAVSVVDLKDLTAASAPVAHLTGTGEYTLTAEEQAAIRNYVQGGGLLVIDPTGGADTFANSMSVQLSAMFPTPPLMLENTHPMFKPLVPGMDNLQKLALRTFASQNMPDDAHFQIFRAGRGVVFYSPFDVTSGLLGTSTWGIVGLDPKYSQSLLKNLILWTSEGAKDK